MFSIPFKVSPAEAECVTCIIQTRTFAGTAAVICWGPESSHSRQNASCSNLVTPLALAVPLLFAPPSAFTGRMPESWRLNGSAVTRLSGCSWHHGCPQGSSCLLWAPALPPLSPCFLWQDFKYSNSRRFLLNLIDLKCVASWLLEKNLKFISK